MPQKLSRAEADRLYGEATDLLRRTDALPIPRNFQLCFEFAEGSNTELVEAFSPLLERGAPLAQSELDLLFDEYLNDPAEQREIGELGEKLGHEVREALRAVQDAAASTGEFGETVDNTANELVDLSNPDKIREAVRSLVDATRHVSQHTTRLSAQLEASADQINQLQTALDRVRLESDQDTLTGVANRKCFDRTLAAAVGDASTQGGPLSLCMIDVDHFKRFNDTHGHRAGDAVLRVIAQVFQHNVRDLDVVARYGGEEFSIIMPKADLASATRSVDRIRKILSEKDIVRRSTGEKLGTVTVSVGVAQLRGDDTLDTLIERADQALYAAKRSGRDRVQPEADGDTAGTRAARTEV